MCDVCACLLVCLFVGVYCFPFSSCVVALETGTLREIMCDVIYLLCCTFVSVPVFVCSIYNVCLSVDLGHKQFKLNCVCVRTGRGVVYNFTPINASVHEKRAF